MFLKLYAIDNHHEKFLSTESTVEVDSTHTQFKKNVPLMTDHQPDFSSTDVGATGSK